MHLSLETSSVFVDYERGFFRSVTHLDLGTAKETSSDLLQPILGDPIRLPADQNNVCTVLCSNDDKDR